MAVVVPFLLSTPFTNGVDQVRITRVVSLHNPVPAFQAYFDQDTGNPIIRADAQLLRGDSFVSFGFPNSPDQHVSTPFEQDEINRIPQNAYAVASAANVYGGGFLRSVLELTSGTFTVPASGNVNIPLQAALNLPNGAAVSVVNGNQILNGYVVASGANFTISVAGGNVSAGDTIAAGAQVTIPNGNAGSALLLLDATVAPVEPGFSRIRVDYVDVNQVNQTEYFDMPFWEGWDINPRNVQTIVDYVEGAFEFITEELSRLKKQLTFVESHEQLKGLSVSGTLTTTQATSGLMPNIQPHSMPTEALQKVVFAKDVPVEPLPTVTVNNITGVAPAKAYPGDTIVVTVDYTPGAADTLVLLNTIMPTTVDIAAKTLTATLPRNFPFSMSLPLFVVNNNLPKTDNFILNLTALPIAYSMTTAEGVAFGKAGDMFTITGRNFTATQGTVTFTPGVNATITAWSDASITGTIPNGVQPGPVTVTVNGKTTTLNFSLRDPSTLDTFQITPGVETITAGQTLQFSALFNNAQVSPTFSVVTPYRNLGPGNVTWGTIDSTGLYNAPATTSQPLTVKIIANYKTLYGHSYAEASVVVLPATNQATIAPTSVSVAPNYTQRFTLSPSGGGAAYTDVDWYVNGVLRGDDTYGTITDSGLYQAPALRPVTGTVYVTGIAYSGGTTYTSIAAVHLQAAGASLPARKFIQVDEKTTYDYTCNPGDTIIIGSDYDNRIYPPDGCGGCGENSFSWTAPMTPGVYSIQAQGSCLKGSSSGGGPIPIAPAKAIATFSGTSCTAYPLATKYSVNVVNPQPAAPQLSSIGSACPGQQVTVTGQYFPSDVQCYLAGSNELFPMVTGSLSTTDHITYTFNVTIPTNIPANATGLQVYVKGSTGTSNNVGFIIPGSCAAPPPPANFQVTGPPSVCASSNAQFKATYNGSDVTTLCTWSSNASGAVKANDGLFYAPATTGTYTMTASYNGLTNGASIIVQTCTPTTPPSSTCDNLTVQPANPIIYIPAGQQQFTAYLQANGGSPQQTIPDQWLVNGIPGGNAQVGTIDGNGLYTAPLQSPGYIHIQVSATKTITKTS